MKKLLFLLLLSPCIGFAQEDSVYPRLVGDTVLLKCGYKIVKGEKLKVGTGSMDDGDFKFIRRSATSMFQFSSTSGNNSAVNSANALPRASSKLEYKVVRIDKRGSKKHGFVLYPIINIGTIRYEIDLENAIESGELMVPDECNPKKLAAAPVIIKQELSLADELTKLKKLHDDGVLNKDEYEAAKKKLLEKN